MVLARDAELKFVALQYVVLCHKNDKKYAGIHKKKLYIIKGGFLIMYHGIYKGAAAAAQLKKILILGESHHDIDLSTSTQDVMEDYLGGKHSETFHKMALAFGIGARESRDVERALLWNKVFFGNYVDVSLDGPSGEGDKTAVKLILGNKDHYNQELAEFIKTHEIDKVFCFSFRVFDMGLPEAPALFPDVFKKVNGRRYNLWCARTYGPDSLFERNVELYGIPHPTSWRGFGAEDIAKYLKPVFEDCCG